MAIVTISKFNGGLNTQYDADELPLSACASTSNFEIDKHGMLYKRTPSNKTKDGLIGNFVVVRKWVSGDGNAYWIVYNDASEKIIRYDSDWTNATNLSTAMGGLADVQMYDFGGEIRFANGKSFSPSIYQYIDRKYFWSDATVNIKSVTAHDYDTVTPRNDAITYTIETSTENDKGGSLASDTTYYYKFTYLFDGNQESPMPEGYTSAETTSGGNNETLILTLTIQSSSFNERVTGINIYRSSDNTNYYKIKTVSTLGSNDPEVQILADAISEKGFLGLNEGSIVDLSSYNSTSYSLDFYYAVKKGSNHVIQGNSGEALLLDSAEADSALTFPADGWMVYDTTPLLSEDHTGGITGWNGNEIGSPTYQALSVDGRDVLWLRHDTPNGDGVYYDISQSGLNNYYIRFTAYSTIVHDWQIKYSTDATNWVNASDPAGGAGDVTYISSSSSNSSIAGYFTTTSSTVYIAIVRTDANVSDTESVYINTMDVHEWRVKGDTCLAGDKTVISPTVDLGVDDAKVGKRILVGTSANGNNDASAEIRRVTKSTKYGVEIDSVYTGSYAGSGIRSYFSGDYIWRKKDSSNIDLIFYDSGLSDGAIHPTSETQIDVNYKYSQYLDGRLYVANIKLDPDNADEDHNDWILYSEILQPDVLTNTNYFQVKDLQGGEITGLSTILGDLIVFMERGIYRLRIPSESPSSWSLIEAEENIGCIAPNSLTKVKDTIFFAGNDNMYALNPNFELTTVTETIRDDYQASANLDKTLTIYDVKKQRLLCRFGDAGSKIYSLGLDTDRETWNLITPGTDFDNIKSFGIDENLKVYTTRQNVSASKHEIMELNPATPGAESISCTRLSSEIPTSALAGRNMIRRFTAKYESNDNTTYKIYTDGDLDNPAWTEVFYNQLGNWDTIDQDWDTISAPWTERRNKSLVSRVGARARFFQIGIESEASNNIGLEIEKLEVELD